MTVSNSQHISANDFMPSSKRKRSAPVEKDESASEIEEVPMLDNDVDISANLLGGRAGPGAKTGSEEEEESDEDDFIKETMSKFNMKSGTEVLKKTKGKNKITKGEVGGGSFQSMGTCLYSFFFSPPVFMCLGWDLLDSM